ncbi:MAG: GNAT family N-acetyltransferase [Candidatus Aminicenantaceae bacterium]
MFAVRPYLPKDREKIRLLCCDTGYLGNPVEKIFQDRKWFADLNTKYYLNYEFDSCFVAESKEEIVGYVLGSTNPLKYNLLFYTLIASPLFFIALFKCLTKKYDEISRAYIKRLVFRGSFERPRRPRRSAHFHINVKDGYRKKGVGKALVQTLFRHFLSKNVDRVYGELIHIDQLRDEILYTSHGFKIFDKKPTTLLGKESGNAYLMTVTTELEKVRELWEL